jgi:hypothetical protein
LSLSGNWAVPSAPGTPNNGQLVYIFPAITDATGANDIVQPVLQWGNNGNFGGTYFVLASWYVIGSTYGYSTPISVSSGQSLSGSMTSGASCGRGCNTWTITGTDTSTGKSTTINVNLGAQNLLFGGSLEAYYMTGCSDYPGSPTVFSSLSATDVTGKVTPNWTVFVYLTGCGQQVTINSATKVTLYY